MSLIWTVLLTVYVISLVLFQEAVAKKDEDGDAETEDPDE